VILKRSWFFYFANWFLRTFFGIFTRLDVRGLENVPRDGALIVAMNHMSFLDPLLVCALLPRQVIPMAKIEAFRVPVVGWWVKWYGAYPIRRGEADVSAFKTSLQILKSGGVINIAVEGHRSETGMLQRGREGAIIIGHRSNAPMLPVAIWGSRELKHNIRRLHRTDIHIRIGETVVTEQSGKPSRDELSDATDEFMVRIAEMMPTELRGYYVNASRTDKYLRSFRVTRAGTTMKLKKEVVTAP
jgi:1-acyl-sn-glycerol-3-phosphate acyltransferase